MLMFGIIFALLAQGATPLTVADSRTFPESITSTPNGTLIIGSTVNGIIYRRVPGDTQARRWILPENGTPAPAIFGVLADPRRSTLWACRAKGPPGKGVTGFARYSLAEGKLLESKDFPGTGLCNDIALDERGAAYATDISNARIMRLQPGGTVETWFSDPALKGVDGIVIHRDREVIVNSISTGKLFAIPITRNGAPGPMREIALSRPLERPDGMRLKNRDTLLIVEGVGRLAKVKLGKSTAAVETLHSGLVEPVGVAPVGNTGYVVQGHTSYLFQSDLKGKDPGPTNIYALSLGR